jgi:hypothetical protein
MVGIMNEPILQIIITQLNASGNVFLKEVVDLIFIGKERYYFLNDGFDHPFFHAVKFAVKFKYIFGGNCSRLQKSDFPFFITILC